jgi:hypothetical protein
MASHKTLKSVVRSLAESLTGLLNYHTNDFVMGHVVYAAWQTGATEFRVDLLSGVTTSSALLVPRVRDSVARYVEWFPDIVRRSNSDLDFVTEAELAVSVDPTIRRARGKGLQESPFKCTVRIVDDRGKVYSHCISDWWFPERRPPREKTKQWWRFW